MLFLTFPKTLPPREPPEQLRAEYLDSCHCETLDEPCSAREEHEFLVAVLLNALVWLVPLGVVGLLVVVLL